MSHDVPMIIHFSRRRSRATVPLMPISAWRRTALVAVFLTAWLATCGFPAPAAEPADDADAGLHDCVLTMRIRKVLLQDEALGSLNLGVTARGSSVSLWGTTPNADLEQRAVDKVRTVPGVRLVRSEIQVAAPDDPLVLFLKRPFKQSQLPEIFHTHRMRPPVDLTSRNAAKPDAVEQVQPLPLPVSTPAISIPRLPEAQDLDARLQRLQKEDARYQRISWTIHHGQVRLRAPSDRQEYVWEMAREVARWPGVERVLVESAER